MKGIILAGGLGTRMGIISRSINKHCNLIYRYPMIMYPIFNMRDIGIRDIMIIVSDVSAGQFIQLLGDGSEFGLNIYYGYQSSPNGIAGALKIARKYVGYDKILVMLGDNFFHPTPTDIVQLWSGNGAKVILYPTDTPREFGIAVFNNTYRYISNDLVEYYIGNDTYRTTIDEFMSSNEMVNIAEKPKDYLGNLIVTGMYMYDNTVWDIIDNITMSDRGELEISSVNVEYLDRMEYDIYDGMWFDCGNPDKLLCASNYVKEYVDGCSKDMWKV